MKKILILLLAGLPLVFSAFSTNSLPNLFLILGSVGWVLYVVLALVPRWWKSRTAENENRPPYQFNVIVSSIWLIWLIAAVALFVIFSRRDDPPSPFVGHIDELKVAAFNPGADRLASAGLDNSVRMWNILENKLEREFSLNGERLYANFQNSFTSLAYSPDDAVLAIGGTDKTVRIWNFRDNVLLRQLDGHSEAVRVLAFSPDGTLLATGSTDKTTRIWNTADWTLRKKLEGHIDRVTSLAFSADGKYLATGSADKTIRLWQTSDGAFFRSFAGNSEGIIALTFTLDSSALLSASEKGIMRRWRWKPDEPRSNSFEEMYKERSTPITSAAFTRDGTYFVTADNDKVIRLWSTTGNPAPLNPPNPSLAVVASYSPTREFRGHSDVVTSLVFDSSGSQFLSGSNDKSIRLWNVDGSSNRPQDTGSEVAAVTLDPDASDIAVAGANKPVRIFQAKDGNQHYFPLEATVDEIIQLEFSRDGKTLVSASRNGYIHNWSSSDGRLQRELLWRPSLITSMAVNPADANSIAVGNDKGIVRLWNSTGNPHNLTEFAGSAVTSLAYSPKGDILAGGGINQPIRFWKSDGTFLSVPLPEQKGKITYLVFSPDGKKLATASSDKTVVVWSFGDPLTRTNPVSIELPAQLYPASVLLFNNDNQTLFTGSSDGKVRIWNVVDGALIDVLDGYALPILSLGMNASGTIHAAGAVGPGPDIRYWAVVNNKDLQNRMAYALKKWLYGTEMTKVFWAIFFGLIIAVGIVIVPVYGYSGVAARFLLAQYPGYDPKLAHQALFSVQIGIHKIHQSVANGELKTLRPEVGDAHFGGPGVLMVEEGHAVVLMQSGRVTRVVGNGITWLRAFERAHMPIYLPDREEHIHAKDVMTLDKMLLSDFEFYVFHRADPGDRSGDSGQYRFDPGIILGKIWSPSGSDWREAIKSVSESAVRDLTAQYNFDQIIALTGTARRDFIDQLTDRINLTTLNLQGVMVVGTNIGAIAISESAKDKLQKKILAEVDHQIEIIAAEAEKQSFVRKGEGQAEAYASLQRIKSRFREEIINQVFGLLSQGNPPPIANPMVAARFLRLVEDLAKAVIRDDVTGVRYTDALEAFAKSGGDKTIYLGTEGIPQAFDGTKE